MKKIAFFVEGDTELFFIERLLTEIATRKNIYIDKKKIIGGATVPKKIIPIEYRSPPGCEIYYALIYNCCGDSQVKSRILEEHESLTNNGYHNIVGIRDVFPDFQKSDIPRLRQGLRTRIKTNLAPVNFILSEMEIEAWFIAETTHYAKINPSLTCDIFFATFGINPKTDDATNIQNPADTLDNFYKQAGENYKKGKSDTINAIDYSAIYLETAEKINDLKYLVKIIDTFMS